MNRPLKFRAWDEPTDVNGPTGMSYNARPDCDATEIMQFTGLYDKNGKEIYEGDILRDGHGLGDIGSVVFDASQLRYRVKEKQGSTPLSTYSQADAQWEVIGNIYEHPHLLQRGGLIQCNLTAPHGITSSSSLSLAS